MKVEKSRRKEWKKKGGGREIKVKDGSQLKMELKILGREEIEQI